MTSASPCWSSGAGYLGSPLGCSGCSPHLLSMSICTLWTKSRAIRRISWASCRSARSGKTGNYEEAERSPGPKPLLSFHLLSF